MYQASLLHTMANIDALITAVCVLWPLMLGAVIIIFLFALIICKLVACGLFFPYVAFPIMKLRRYNADIFA